MQLIREEGYTETMEHTVLPYLRERVVSGSFERIPGENIVYRSFSADHPKADLVMVHGFTEGIDKFNEVIYYFLKEGFQVWQIQQRGHGKSVRLVDVPSLVHIDSFKALLDDLHYFVSKVVDQNRKDPALPKCIYGHSMGGGVSAAYLETWPDDFQKAVLTSPMLELDSGGTPTWLASLYSRFQINRGKGKEYLPGTSPFNPEPDFENSCGNSRARYDYWFPKMLERKEYQTSAPSIATALEFLRLTRYATSKKNCSKVKADVLLIQAGRDQVVKPGGQETFIRQIGKHGRLLRLENAKHEIYMGVNADLEKYWKEVMEFLH